MLSVAKGVADPVATSSDEESVTKILKELDTFAATYPKSPAPRRMALTLSTGAEFRNRVKPYLINGLEKGIPSLFVDIKSLYTDAEKMVAVGEVVEDVIESLQKDASLHADGESRFRPGLTGQTRLHPQPLYYGHTTS